MLGQRARQRVRQRQDLGRAEPGRLTAADARELTDDLLEPPPSREGRRQSQHERDQTPQRLGHRHRIGAAFADLHEHFEGLPVLGLVDRDERGADRRLHPVGGAGETVGPRLDHRLALAARRDGRQPLQLLFGAHADVQHLLALASVPEHGDAETARFPGETVRTRHVFLGRAVGQVDRLADAVVRVTLEGRLVAHMPLERDLVRGLEHGLDLRGQPRDAVQRAAPGDLAHQRFRVEPVTLGDRLEGFVDEGQHPFAVGLPHTMLERQREDRLDARRAARDHRDCSGRGDRRDGGVPHRPPVLVDGAAPVRERTALLGEPRGLVVGLLLHERHHLRSQADGLLAVVRNAHEEQQVRPPHDAETDPPVGLHCLVDRGQRVRVHLDHVVQEADGEPDDPFRLLPVDRPHAVGRLLRELGHVERS